MSPTDTLDTLTNLLPFNSIVEKWCYRVVACLALLPNKHPFQKPVKLSAKHLVKNYYSPLHNLFSLLNTDPKNVCKVTVLTHNLAKTVQLPFKISILANKESLIKEAQDATEEIQVFMDSSVIEGKVGAAVILTRWGKDHRSLHFHLRSVIDFNNFKAKLVGLLLGMQLIKTEKVARCRIALGTDNQAVISTIQKELQWAPKALQYLAVLDCL